MTRKRAVPVLLIGCLFLFSLAAAPVAAEDQAATLEDEILAEKCSLCHSSKRIMTMGSEEMMDTLKRMQKKNPDWITDIERDHIAEVLSKLLEDSSILATRKAWQEAVARGDKLFGDPKLGTNGKACTDCHTRESMRQSADGFPRYDLKMRRIMSFEDQIMFMIKEQLAGEQYGPDSQKVLDLLAYLKSLY